MDIEPLSSDQLPPRYAVESDEEEDEINPLPRAVGQPDQPILVKVIGENLTDTKPLIVAFGTAGAYWAKGADLGEQVGAVAVNGTQVGLIFTPSWTTATVLVSEALTNLPYSMMYPYVESIIHKFKPSKVSLLDQYAAPMYIASKQLSFHSMPIRYIITANASVAYPPEVLQTFDPPNLVSATSAAFMALLNEPHMQCPALLFLLPSKHAFAVPPRSLEPLDFSRLQSNQSEWSVNIMNDVHTLLDRGIGGKSLKKWEVREERDETPKPAQSKPKIGEGSLYI